MRRNAFTSTILKTDCRTPVRGFHAGETQAAMTAQCKQSPAIVSNELAINNPIKVPNEQLLIVRCFLCKFVWRCEISMCSAGSLSSLFISLVIALIPAIVVLCKVVGRFILNHC